MSLNNLKKILLLVMLHRKREQRKVESAGLEICLHETRNEKYMGEFPHLLPDLLSGDRELYFR